jgi:hypothetical protein
LCWELRATQAGARGREGCCIPHVQIQPSLQFLCNFVMINAAEGSLCFQTLKHYVCWSK